jgi:hypothetical protein
MGCSRRFTGCFGFLFIGFLLVFALPSLLGSSIRMSTFTLNSDQGSFSTLVPTIREPSNPGNHTSRRTASYSVTKETDEAASMGRTQRRMNVVIDPNDDPDVVIGAITQAVQDGLARNPDATSVAVYANSQSTQSDLVEVGRGFASVDGKGVDGDGEGLFTKDERGKIQIELISDSGPRIVWVDLK